VDNERSFSPPTIGGIPFAARRRLSFTDPPFKSTGEPIRAGLAQINYFQTYINQFLTNLSSPSYTNPVTGYSQFINTGSMDQPSPGEHHSVQCGRLSASAASSTKTATAGWSKGPQWDCDRCLGTGGTATTAGRQPVFQSAHVAGTGE
jgi:hypothetical protein